MRGIGILLSVLSCAVVLPTSVLADFVVSTREQGLWRIAEDGTVLVTFEPPLEVEFESFAQTHAASTDGKTVYGFTNTLGFADVLAVDALTGEYLEESSIFLFGCCIPGAEEFVSRADQALIRSNDTFGRGDLFAISDRSPPDFGTDKVLKRLNTSTQSFVETISPPTPQEIYDFDFGPDSRLYFWAEDGIYVYTEHPTNGFELPSSVSLIPGLEGWLAFGPDGNLYVRDQTTGNIDRYTASGGFIDTFIPSSVLRGGAEFGTIQFGPDGDLYVLECCFDGPFEPAGGIGRYDGTSGQLISTTIDVTPLFFGGRITKLPVPEPTGFMLAFVAAALLPLRYRGR